MRVALVLVGPGTLAVLDFETPLRRTNSYDQLEVPNMQFEAAALGFLKQTDAGSNTNCCNNLSLSSGVFDSLFLALNLST